MNILRAFNPGLYDRLQPYRPAESQMPWAYSKANPNGRTLSNDWGLMGALPAFQPWQKIPRIDRAYRVPLPFKQTSGKGFKKWMLWDPSYPLSPGAQIEPRDIWTVNGTFTLPHCLVDVAEDDGAATFAAFIGGAWVDVFHRYTKKIPFTSKLLKVCWGLRPDITVAPPEWFGGPIRSDCMAWFPEWGMTLVKVTG